MPNQLAGVFEFVFVDDGVHRDIHLGCKAVGIGSEANDVFDRIARRSTRTEPQGTDVDGIGSVVDGRHAALQIFGWSQQFEGFC